MANAGILMHIRHLETVGWEELVWGVPDEDSLGSLPKIVELLLEETKDEPITTVVFGCGPSTKDGLSEGEYTKKYLIDNIDRLVQFPRFSERLNAEMLTQLTQRLERTIVTPLIKRSIDEVVLASEVFAEQKVRKVYQVTAASHAPRCVQIQAAARAAGLVPANQQWFLVADDRYYEGTEPFTTLVMEAPHRGDDPLIGFTPSLPALLRSYQYDLSPEDKKELARMVEDFMRERAEVSDIRNFSSAQ